MSYFETNKLVILAYPKGAGGKFVSNCLALSQGVFPFVEVPTKIYRARDKNGRILEYEYYVPFKTVPHLASELLDELLRDGDLKFRLAYVLRSLPDSRAEMTLWRRKYEFSCHYAYGYGETRLKKTSPSAIRRHILSDPPEMRGLFRKLQDSGLLHFMNCHEPASYPGFLKLFPNCHRIRLVNGAAWIRKSHQIGKFHRDEPETVADHPENTCFNRSIDFDVESFFQEPRFLEEIRNLYDFFGLKDYDEQAIVHFYRRYMDLHL